MTRLVLLLIVVLAVLAAPRPASVIPADSLGSGFLWVGVEPDLARTGAPELSVQPSTVTPTRSAGAPPLAGTATWYADPRAAQGSLYAAAGPALRRALGPHWRGATVRVCSAYSVPPRQLCVSVRLGDACRCPSRVIDLSWRAFSDPKIGLGVPLSRGVVKVTVTP